MAHVGQQVVTEVAKLLRGKPQCVDECLQNLGQDEDAGPGVELLEEARAVLGRVMGVPTVAPPPSSDPGLQTPVIK